MTEKIVAVSYEEPPYVAVDIDIVDHVWFGEDTYEANGHIDIYHVPSRVNVIKAKGKNYP